ncbi:unnamed protein product, partial [Heterosigma akashiwo]
APVQLATTQVTKPMTTMMAEKSKSLPFLTKPEKLDGSMVGDVGFDPLRITDQLTDLNFVRAAELKHGRVAMLAVVGFAIASKVNLYGDAAAISTPLDAPFMVPFAGNMQILSFIGIIELATLDSTYAGEGAPGDYGWDPLNFSKGKTPEQMKDLQLKELKNGRLAMWAILG